MSLDILNYDYLNFNINYTFFFFFLLSETLPNDTTVKFKRVVLYQLKLIIKLLIFVCCGTDQMLKYCTYLKLIFKFQVRSVATPYSNDFCSLFLHCLFSL